MTKLRAGTVLYADENSDEALERARAYCRKMQLTMQDVAIRRLEDEIIVKAKKPLELK